MNKARRHHYCPQFYLEAFTENGSRDSRLWVIDKEKKVLRPSKPINEAHQRDFYRLDVDEGKDPLFLESQLSEIEGAAAPVIRNVLETNSLPAEEGMGYLLSFLGLLAVRTPVQRIRINSVMQQVSKIIMSMVTSSEQQWEYSKRRARENGQDIPESVTRAQAAESIDSGKVIVEAEQNYQLTTMLQLASTITDLLVKRNWIVAVAEGRHFVTSDNPVGLSWMTPMNQPPGFGLRKTQVTVPLSKTVALVGVFGNVKPTPVRMDAEWVAAVNNQAIFGATRFVYSGEQDFVWRAKDGQVLGVKELMKCLHGP